MPQSLTKLYAHLIFSTKNRQHWLDDEILTARSCRNTISNLASNTFGTDVTA